MTINTMKNSLENQKDEKKVAKRVELERLYNTKRLLYGMVHIKNEFAEFVGHDFHVEGEMTNLFFYECLISISTANQVKGAVSNMFMNYPEVEIMEVCERLIISMIVNKEG